MTDKTGKIYSRFKGRRFNDIFPEIDVYYESDFFLYCNSYKLMVPIKRRPHGNLNIFELTILRMYNLHFWTSEDLADRIGMELDFINFVILSLKERGYLTEDGIITDKGSKEICQSLTDENTVDDEEYVTARIFAIKKSGELLPIICLDEQDIKFCEVDTDAKIIRGAFGASAGFEKAFKFHYYNSGKADRSRVKPKKVQIIKLFQDYNRICRNTNNSIIKYKGSDLSVEFAEDVFIHLKAIMQRNNVSVNVISDGLVSNDSVVVNFFETEGNLHFFDNLYERANRFKEKHECEVGVPRKRYYQITAALNILPQKGSSFEEREQANRTNNKVVRNLFAALEWALHFYLQQHPIKDSLKMAMLTQSSNENKHLALKAAKKLGFDTDNVSKNKSEILLSQAHGYKLQHYFNSTNPQPNMDVLLPLCLVQAVNDNGHIWDDIAIEFPRLLSSRKDANLLTNTMHSSEKSSNDISCAESIQGESSNTPEQVFLDEQAEHKEVKNVRFSLPLLREIAKITRHSADKVYIGYIKAMSWYNDVEKLIKLLLPDYNVNTQDSIGEDNLALQKVGDINALKEWFSPLDLQKFASGLAEEILSVSLRF